MSLDFICALMLGTALCFIGLWSLLLGIGFVISLTDEKSAEQKGASS